MKILLIAYFFPPDCSSGAFRPMYFARDLQAAGHQVTVLTVKENDFFPYQPQDSQLLETVGKDVRVVRTEMFNVHRQLVQWRDRLFHRNNPVTPEQPTVVSTTAPVGPPRSPSRMQAVKDLITDLLAIPDQYNGWIRPAVRMGKHLIQQDEIDVIYATGSPWSSFLVGEQLKRLTGKPLVLDFRDPWVGQPNYLVKRPYCQRQELKLEQRVIRHANHVIANTPELRAELRRRYPQLADQQVTAITNGFEAYMPSSETDRSAMTITHAGTLNLRNPKALLQASIRLIERGDIPHDKLRLVMLGGIEVADVELPGVLAHPLLKDVVQILPRMPYHEAIHVQQRSDVLLLLQPNDFPLQIPRKLYEYIAYRKPILGITTENSATARMIRENQLGLVVDDDPAVISVGLRTLYRQWEQNSLDLPKSHCDQFLNQQLSSRLERVFQTVIAAQTG